MSLANVGSFEPTFFAWKSMNATSSVQAECRDKMLAFWHDRGAAADAVGVKSSATRSASANCRKCLISSLWERRKWPMASCPCVSVRTAITAQAERRDGVLAHRHDRGEREGLRRSPQGQHEGRRLPQDDGRRPQGCALVDPIVALRASSRMTSSKIKTQTRLSLRFFSILTGTAAGYFFPAFGTAGFPAAVLPAAAFSFLNSAWALRMSAMKVSFVCRLG